MSKVYIYNTSITPLSLFTPKTLEKKCFLQQNTNYNKSATAKKYCMLSNSMSARKKEVLHIMTPFTSFLWLTPFVKLCLCTENFRLKYSDLSSFIIHGNWTIIPLANWKAFHGVRYWRSLTFYSFWDGTLWFHIRATWLSLRAMRQYWSWICSSF